MTPELNDLLEKYADTCTAIARLDGAIEFEQGEGNDVPPSVLSALQSVEKRKGDLEREISDLFVEAGEAVARLERQHADELLEVCRGLLNATVGLGGNTDRMDELVSAQAKARSTINKVYQARAKNCACHTGSVCTSACEQGKHHEGCTKGEQE